MDVVTLGITVDATGAVSQVRLLGQEMEKTGKKGDELGETVKRLAELFGLYEAAKWARETVDLGARYETLGVVLDVVGRTAGQTGAQLSALQGALMKTGISAIEARENIIRMAQAHLDLSQATKLARVAQDAAVIGNLNSSEAFDTLIHGIESGRTEVLRTIGINVDFEASYRKLARQLGLSAESLTETQKAQARANVVLASGAAIAGTYEAAMGTAGKQIKSTERYLEDMRVKVAEAFLPQYTQAVFAYANTLKFLGEKAPLVSGALVGVAAAVGALTLSIKGSSLLSLVTALANPVVLTTIAALGTLAVVVGSAAANAAIATQQTNEYYESLKNMSSDMLRRKIHATNDELVALQRRAALGISTPDDAKRYDELTRSLRDYQNALNAKKLGKPGPDDAVDSAHAQAFRALVSERQNELDKLTALNKAYGANDLALQILGIRYDAMIQKSKDAKEHQGAELAQLNGLTDAITEQQIAAAKLAQQKQVDIDAQKSLVTVLGLQAQTNATAVSPIAAEHAAALAEYNQQVATATIGLADLAKEEKTGQIYAEFYTREHLKLAQSLAQVTEQSRQSVEQAQLEAKSQRLIGDAVDYARIQFDENNAVRTATMTLDQQAAAVAVEAAHKVADAQRESLAVGKNLAPWKNLIGNIEEGIATFARDLFTKPRDAFRSLVGEIQSLWGNLLEDLAKRAIEKRLLPRLADLAGLGSTTSVTNTTSQVADSIDQTVSGGAAVASVANIGALVGVVGAITGGLTILSSVFGSGVNVMRETLKANTEQMRKLTAGLQNFTVSGSNTASAAAALRDLFTPANAKAQAEIVLHQTGPFSDLQAQINALTPVLSKFGLTFDQLEAIAKSYGLDVLDSQGHIVSGALQQLATALDTAAKAAFTFGTNLSSTQSLLELQDKLAGKTSPQDELNRAVAAFQTLAPKLLPGSYDTTSAAGQAALRAQLQSDVAKAVAGTIPVSDFGGFQNINDFVSATSSVIDALNAMGAATDAVTTALTHVPTGFKLARAVYTASLGQAPSGVPPITLGVDTIGPPVPTVPVPTPVRALTSSAPSTATTPGSTTTAATQPPVTITGPVTITVAGDNADALLDQLVVKLQRLGLRGGVTRFSLATRSQ